ncbi:nitrate reductase [Pseudaestuariivita rosea]|uniref:nitrate reductase n=1 Tax=Pseudaestuariivita rosea TaxID=2763263 RepID=UPI001ABBBC0B|nr:nitrate reductase [Pseudaestuariivita rosea]
MTVCTTCPYCGVGCGVLAGPDGSIKGDPDHPANLGRLCSKGSALGETLGPEGRLLTPQIGGQKASWNTALDLVADKFTQAIQDYGPDSVAFYVSGQLLTEDYYVANKLMKGYIGSANIDTNSRLCMASSVAGHKRAFGSDTVPGCYEDLELADLVVLVGSNLAWCHPVLYQRIAAAKTARPQMKVINIDPRVTATSDLADLHLQIRPDGDAALFNGLLAQLAAEDRLDRRYILDHVDGFEDALQAAKVSDPLESGLSPDELDDFYRLWIDTPNVVTVYSQGVNQSCCGTDKVNAIINCHLATGRIGLPGCGPFSVTGQPNAMGGREVGGLANMLACHLDIENKSHRQAVQKAWNSPTICKTPGLKAVDLFQACASGQIKALWIMSTNPAVSMPDADAVTKAIKTVPFVVVSDILEKTDTTEHADILLPAAGWGEKSGTVTNSERRISRQRQFTKTPGQARPDWRIICDVAARMGWAEAFDYSSEAYVFREYATLSSVAAKLGSDFDISGLMQISDATYHELMPVQWPVPEGQISGGRFFSKGNFHTANGRARMLPITPPRHNHSDEYPFRLNSGRIRDQWHTMTRTGRSARLSQHMAEPYVEIHPQDAFAIGLRHADLARLVSAAGRAICRVLISDRVQRGQVFVPMHWTNSFAPAGRSNPMVMAQTDPVSGQPALKGSNVRIERFEAGWYGFVVSADHVQPARPYAAVGRTETGWQAEVAGVKVPRDWVAEARSLTGIYSGQASVLSDVNRGTARVALHQDDQIVALMFAARTPVSVSRRYVTGLIGTKTPAQVALAGRPVGEFADPGAIVCSCFNVGINTLRTQIAGGVMTVEALGANTCAGTNCGSCRPELAALIASSQPKVAAE